MAWSWKDKDRDNNDQLNLLYEPGNWGDLLKHLWAIELSKHRLHCGLESTQLFDPFSGAESYPLTVPTAERIDRLPPLLKDRLQPLCQQRFPSTGVVLHSYVEDGTFRAEICEQDPVRRATWSTPVQAVDETPLERLKHYLKSSGEQSGFRPNLALWDPYDFFEQWSHAIPFLLQFAHRCDLLIYFLNKSPQGVGKLRNYQAMRARVDQPLLVGRVGSDSLLPRSYHEMWLLGPSCQSENLAQALSQVTRALNQHVSDQSCFESISGA